MRGNADRDPVAFEMSVLEEGHWGSELTPRFQFKDRRLEGLCSVTHSRLRLLDGPGRRSTPLGSSRDRLYETVRQPFQGRRGLVDVHAYRQASDRLEYIDQHIGSPIDVDKVAFLTGLARTQFGKSFARRSNCRYISM